LEVVERGTAVLSLEDPVPPPALDVDVAVDLEVPVAVASPGIIPV